MNSAQVISTCIFILGTFAAIVSALYLINTFKQRLPEQLAIRLEQFARMAVLQVEQRASKLSPAAKKQLAIAAVATLLKAFNLPPIAAEAVDIAIEGAVFLLPAAKIVDSTSTPIATETPKTNG
jgi:hypothetical protein